jgi:hypothetical protein
MTLHLDMFNSIPRLLAHSQRLLQFLFVRGHPLSHFGVICKLSQNADKLLHRLVLAIDKISRTGVGPERLQTTLPPRMRTRSTLYLLHVSLFLIQLRTRPPIP